MKKCQIQEKKCQIPKKFSVVESNSYPNLKVILSTELQTYTMTNNLPFLLVLIEESNKEDHYLPYHTKGRD